MGRDLKIQYEAQQTDIRNLLSFRLTRLSQVSDSIGQRWLGRQYGLRLLEWRVIGLIAAIPFARFAQLAAMLHIDKGQLSRVTSALGDRGLIKAVPDPDDQRGRVMRLTSAGYDLYQQILPGAIRRNQDMVRDLSKTEIETLFQLLDRLQPFMDARSEHESKQ